MEPTRDQFEGCILGLAIGDALGYPAEFRSREQILREIGREGITDFIGRQDERFSRPFIAGVELPAGTYTDDTQMSLALAEGLLELGAGDDLDQLMTAVGRHFVAWSESPQNNRSPGQTCMMGCRNLGQGVPWREAGVAGSKGCGSAMRVAPIGLLYHDDLDRLCEVARASSLLTHGHDAAVEGAAAAALMVALALRGASAEQMYEEIERRCFDHSRDLAACLVKVPALVEVTPGEVLTKSALGEAWVAEEAVASALYCYWRHADSYREAVLTAVNTDGDSDSIAAITGSVLGARHGLEAIPRQWVRGVENSTDLVRTGQRLWAAR